MMRGDERACPISAHVQLVLMTLTMILIESEMSYDYEEGIGAFLDGGAINYTLVKYLDTSFPLLFMNLQTLIR